MVRVLFFRDYPLVDGTFTLLYRLARRLKEDGNESYFLFSRRNIDSTLLSEISKYSVVYYMDELADLKAKGVLPVINVIHGIIAANSLYLTYETIKGKYFPEASVVIGVYHPRAYFNKTRIGFTPDSKLHRALFRTIPIRNIVFMNSVVKTEHENAFKMEFDRSPTIPIPVDVPNKAPERHTVNRYKIVSIGRLVEFKLYVIEIIQTIVALKKEGYPFEYHIYGDGPMKKKVQDLIVDLDATEYIFLHGSLAYTEFEKVVSDAGVFIGMGTSIIESSGFGIPSLLAVDSRNKFTYGWFYDINGYEVGEQVPGAIEYPYREFLIKIVSVDDDTYKEMSRKSWEKAQVFSIDNIIRDYYEFLKNSDANYSFIVPKWKRFFLKLIRQPFKWRILSMPGHRHR